jgi:hypothetical protein
MLTSQDIYQELIQLQRAGLNAGLDKTTATKAAMAELIEDGLTKAEITSAYQAHRNDPAPAPVYPLPTNGLRAGR